MKTKTSYEDKVLQEINVWEQEKPGSFFKAIDILGAPIRLMASSVPEEIKRSVGAAIMGFMEMLKDLSFWTFSDRNILNEARKAGITVDRVSDLANHDLEKLDKIARSYFSSNKLIAALEGAGCGLGGLALIAADIPVLLGISFRSIQQIGSAYGFNMQDPDMAPVIMSVFYAGTGVTVAVKSSVMADMHIAAAALAREMTYKEIAEKTKTGVIVDLLSKSSHALPKQIAENITKRKLSQFIPIVGAAIGAGFNYWFMGNIVISAQMIFRKLYLERKHPTDAEKSSGRLKLFFSKPRMQ